MAKIYYFARINPSGAPGIYNKLTQAVSAMEAMGHQSALMVANGDGGLMKALPSVLFLLGRLLRVKADIVIIRNDILQPVLLIGMVVQRFRGAKVVVDVPTPLANWINEINLSGHKSSFWRLRRTLLIRCSFPWSLWPASKIIQYANESSFFSFGLKGKTILVGNGIDTKNIPLRNLNRNAADKKIVIIGVAALADWHGYDRLIRGIAKFVARDTTGLNICFFVVGDGPVRTNLEQLSVRLGVERHVRFFGFLTGKQLDQLYDRSDIAVASLGLFRVGLSEASSLKSREYVARGLPFVNSGRDIDFEPTPPFVFQVENNESDIDVDALIRWYETLNCDLNFRNGLRRFAEEKLSFHSKISALI
jgi:glycosyltransferase involved in cell wall biosynthesis